MSCLLGLESAGEGVDQVSWPRDRPSASAAVEKVSLIGGRFLILAARRSDVDELEARRPK